MIYSILLTFNRQTVEQGPNILIKCILLWSWHMNRFDSKQTVYWFKVSAEMNSTSISICHNQPHNFSCSYNKYISIDLYSRTQSNAKEYNKKQFIYSWPNASFFGFMVKISIYYFQWFTKRKTVVSMYFVCVCICVWNDGGLSNNGLEINWKVNSVLFEWNFHST